MLRSFHYAPGFGETDHETNLRGRLVRPTAASSSPAATALRTMWDAWREGLAAYRRYEHLRSRGIPHETAVSEALSLGPTRSRVRREPAGPLCFAGQA